MTMEDQDAGLCPVTEILLLDANEATELDPQTYKT